MNRNGLLRLSGIAAMITAGVHSIEGDTLLRTLTVTPEEQLAFVRATHQLGAMGWLAGGVLLVAAGSMASQQARNWIVGVMTVMYGFPAVGNLVLSGGRPAFGWLALALVVVLAACGRQVPIEQAVSA